MSGHSSGTPFHPKEIFVSGRYTCNASKEVSRSMGGMYVPPLIYVKLILTKTDSAFS